MLTNQLKRIAIGDLCAPVQALTRREAVLVNGGDNKDQFNVGLRVAVAFSGLGLIADYIKNGDNSNLGWAGTKIGEGAAKGYLWVEGVMNDLVKGLNKKRQAF